MISHRTDGRTYIYFPLVSREDIRKSIVTGLVDTLFQGDRVEIVSCLLRDADLNDEEIEAVKKLINSRKTKGGRN